MSENKNVCFKLARHIGREVEKIVAGEMYYNEQRGDFEELPEENGEGERLDENGDEIKPASLWDWVERESCGDIRFEVSKSGSGWTVHGGNILIGYGGPNILATDCGVDVYWGSERGSWEFSSETSEAMIEFFKEAFAV